MATNGQRVKVALLSSNYLAVQPTIDEFHRSFPEADPMQVLDEGLVVEFGRAGGLSRDSAYKALEMAKSAEAAGAQAILCTCSTLSPCIADIRPYLSVPVFEIDAAVAEAAMASAKTIALASTAESVLTSVIPFFTSIAKRLGKDPEWKRSVFTQYREYIKLGRPVFLKALASHLVNCTNEADAVIVAQVSMIHCMDYVPEEAKARIFTSVPYAVRAVKKALGY